MGNNLEVIKKHLRAPTTLNQLGLATGLSKEKPDDLVKLQEYASSVLMEIEKTAGDPKKDLSGCTPNSIVQCMIDSAKFKIKIDGRQHAHLVKYGNKATLQIGFRGFIAKIREVIPSSDISSFAVYEGDTLDISSENGFDSYEHKRNDPFADIGKLNGVVGVLYYTKEGKEFQRVETMSKSEIEKIKGCAKQSFIWDKWFIEKAKVAVVKRLCKMTFAEISSIQELVEYDNKENFDMDKDKPKIDETAQTDEFTQKALAEKGGDDVIEGDTVSCEIKKDIKKNAAEIVDEKNITMDDLDDLEAMTTPQKDLSGGE